jgi:hypothetical protein
MPEHSPGCPFAEGEPPPPSGSFEAATQAAVYAFLSEAAYPHGSVITIMGSCVPLDDEGDNMIHEIRIGVGQQAQDRMAADYAQRSLNEEGAPWRN